MHRRKQKLTVYNTRKSHRFFQMVTPKFLASSSLFHKCERRISTAYLNASLVQQKKSANSESGLEHQPCPATVHLRMTPSDARYDSAMSAKNFAPPSVSIQLELRAWRRWRDNIAEKPTYIYSAIPTTKFWIQPPTNVEAKMLNVGSKEGWPRRESIIRDQHLNCVL